MTNINVVIAWRDRPELLKTMQHNAEFFAAVDASVTVVNCGGDVTSFPWSDLEGLGVSFHRVDIDRADFNKGLAINLGVSKSGADTVLLLDADILLADETLGTMQDALTDKCFVTVASVVEVSRIRADRMPDLAIAEVTHSVEFVLPDGTIHRIRTSTLDLAERARAGPGLVLLRRSDFLAVGGMKSTLTGWGWDDIDLIARLQIALGLERREVGWVKHVPHGPTLSSSNQGGNSVSEAQNFKTCLSDYAVGDFGGTYDSDTGPQA